MAHSRFNSLIARIGTILAAPAAALLIASGCSVTGPATIRNGRAAYNDAIVSTGNEQILEMIVRMRYQEPVALLAVTSVTANVRIQGNVAAEFGVGPDSSFSGNLVPLAVGAIYEENPTISYSPVQGGEYFRQLLTPLPIDLTMITLNAGGYSPHFTGLLVRSINGIQNPDTLESPGVVPDPAFDRVSELLALLARKGAITWGTDGQEQILSRFHRHPNAGDEELRELFELLRLGPVPAPGESASIPVYFGGGIPASPAIEIRTRSLFEIFSLAAASVDVPPEHLDSGLAPQQAPPGRASSFIHIRRTAGRPADAMVAIPHHGWWYSIAGTDASSKVAFRLMDALISARIADSAKGMPGTPVLTVPVSR